MASINRVVLVGNLTRDPELRHTPSGTAVCEFGLAVNSREKNPTTEEWEERADFFDVTVWAEQGEACAQYLSKGSPAAVDGRLRQDRWEESGGGKRSKVKVVASSVQFIGSRPHDGDGAADDDARRQQAAGEPEPVAAAADFG